LLPSGIAIKTRRARCTQFDLNLLLATDLNELNATALKDRNQCDKYLKELARDNMQLLMNGIFELPIQSNQVGIMATLPARITQLPREKPLPVAKPMTKWEKFAKAKGIQKRKKDRMVYNEETGEYAPAWGGQAKNDDGSKDWLVEVPTDADPTEDQFSAKRSLKKQRIEKNKKQQMKNTEANSKESNSKIVQDLKKTRNRELGIAQSSSASMGKFDKKLENEKVAKKGVRRKFQPVVSDANNEAESQLGILDKVVGKGQVLNIRKAIKSTKS